MGFSEPYTRSVVQGDYTTIGSRVKITKRMCKPRQPRKPSQPGRRRRGGLESGLLNTEITARSDAMQIAISNSLQSPLLRLPGEIRNKIWEYALGHHKIYIRNMSLVGKLNDVKLGYDARPEGLQDGSVIPRIFVKPAFALPRVCRQMYVETAATVYTLNTFTFTDLQTLDRFIKDRALGQRRLVTSIDVPFEYFRLYADDFRKLFRQTFPNVKRIGIHVQVALSTQRVIPWTWSLVRPLKEPLADTKKRLESWAQEKEGVDLEIDWHGGTSTSFVYLNY